MYLIGEKILPLKKSTNFAQLRESVCVFLYKIDHFRQEIKSVIITSNFTLKKCLNYDIFIFFLL